MTHVTHSKVSRLHSPTVGTAILWAAIVIASAMVLSGTGYFWQLLPLFVGAAFANLLVVERSR